MRLHDYTEIDSPISSTTKSGIFKTPRLRSNLLKNNLQTSKTAAIVELLYAARSMFKITSSRVMNEQRIWTTCYQMPTLVETTAKSKTPTFRPPSLILHLFPLKPGIIFSTHPIAYEI